MAWRRGPPANHLFGLNRVGRSPAAAEPQRTCQGHDQTPWPGPETQHSSPSDDPGRTPAARGSFRRTSASSLWRTCPRGGVTKFVFRSVVDVVVAPLIEPGRGLCVARAPRRSNGVRHDWTAVKRRSRHAVNPWRGFPVRALDCWRPQGSRAGSGSHSLRAAVRRRLALFCVQLGVRVDPRQGQIVCGSVA